MLQNRLIGCSQLLVASFHSHCPFVTEHCTGHPPVAWKHSLPAATVRYPFSCQLTAVSCRGGSGKEKLEIQPSRDETGQQTFFVWKNLCTSPHAPVASSIVRAIARTRRRRHAIISQCRTDLLVKPTCHELLLSNGCRCGVDSRGPVEPSTHPSCT